LLQREHSRLCHPTLQAVFRAKPCLSHAATSPPHPVTRRLKVFLLLFLQKKKCLPYSLISEIRKGNKNAVQRDFRLRVGFRENKNGDTEQ
jgi:hypothetical protein